MCGSVICVCIIRLHTRCIQHTRYIYIYIYIYMYSTHKVYTAHTICIQHTQYVHIQYMYSLFSIPLFCCDCCNVTYTYPLLEVSITLDTSARLALCSVVMKETDLMAMGADSESKSWLWKELFRGGSVSNSNRVEADMPGTQLVTSSQLITSLCGSILIACGKPTRTKGPQRILALIYSYCIQKYKYTVKDQQLL